MKAHRTMSIGTLVTFVLLASTVVLPADDRRWQETRQSRGQLSRDDYQFVVEASRGGLEEVQLGELARQRGMNRNVRNFGERMAADHSRAARELRQIAAQKGAVLPIDLTEKRTTTFERSQSTFDRLERVSGRDFDRRYADEMVRDHKADVKKFRKAARNLDDPDLRAFARNTLPVLERHLRMSEEMQDAVKRDR